MAAALEAVGRLRTFQPGEVLVREGAWSEAAFVVLEGTGEVFRDGEVVGDCRPGHVIAPARARPADATTRAVTPMRVLLLTVPSPPS